MPLVLIWDYTMAERMNMKEMMSDTTISCMREMVKDYLSEMQGRTTDTGALGVSTGFKPLDDLTGGLENGKVYVIGGRPEIGKEEFMLSIILNIIRETELPVLLFSTNRMKSDYTKRLLSMHCDIPTTHLSTGQLEPREWDRLNKKVGTLRDAPLFVHDSMDLPQNELIETVRTSIREKGVKIIFIDCLQMIDFAKEEMTPSERMAKVMYSLKLLAIMTNLPIVAGSMLNRSVEYREGLYGKLPLLCDLANSCYIEELADVVMMVHRPEYYRIYEDEKGNNLRGVMEIVVQKNRLKPSDYFRLNYNQKTGAVSMKGDTTASSKQVSLEELEKNSEVIEKLVKTFDLVER